jgi:RNA polymerase sigma factor (sigma-70 family)
VEFDICTSTPNHPKPIDPIDASVIQLILHQCIVQLPPDQRTVLTMYYEEGKTLQEISQLLRISVSSVLNIRVAATTKLEELLREE